MELDHLSLWYLHQQISPNVKIKKVSLVINFVFCLSYKFYVLIHKLFKNSSNKQYSFLLLPIPELDDA